MLESNYHFHQMLLHSAFRDSPSPFQMAGALCSGLWVISIDARFSSEMCGAVRKKDLHLGCKRIKQAVFVPYRSLSLEEKWGEGEGRDEERIEDRSRVEDELRDNRVFVSCSEEIQVT